MAINTTQNLKLSWYRDMDKVMLDEYTRQPMEYERFVKTSTESKHRYIRKGLEVTLGAAPEIPQGGITPFDAFADGPDKTVYFTRVGTALQFTEDAMDDDMVGITKQAFSEIGKSIAYTRELKAWDLFNSGFVTTTRTGVDGLALFSNAHPVYGLGTTTGDNLVSGAFSKTKLREALDLLENLKQEKDIPIVSRGPYVVVVSSASSTNRWLCEEIIKSEFDPDTANNAVNSINSIYGRNLSYFVSHYLTDSDSWFVVDMSMKNLEFIWRKKLKQKSDEDFNTDNRLYKATIRFMTTFWYWRGIVGSAGA